MGDAAAALVLAPGEAAGRDAVLAARIVESMALPSGADLRLLRADGPPAGAAEGKSTPQRIRDAVVARLGSQVDANLLDVIIKRVMVSTGVK